MAESVCDVSSLKEGQARVYRVNGKHVAIYFDGEDVFAFSPHCPHARANLTKGTFQKDAVRCHWHGWRFSLQDGKGLNNDAELKTYPASIRDGEVMVELVEPEGQPKQEEGEDSFMPEIKWKN
ncbi:MAG: hypothetical protein DRJ14_02800 [Acidobacteria bacterium]|nr:MAG: hypothetical protein DRJ14_02800 [Acidobacteriota bacterium]